MQPDVALNAEYKELYPFSSIVLVEDLRIQKN